MPAADVPPPFEPEPQTGPVFTLSSWGKRLAGGAIDNLAPGFVQIALLNVTGARVVDLLVQLAYLVFIFWNLVRQGNTGQTVGKSVVGIKLVREADAQAVGVPLSIGRYFLHIIDALPCLVGYFNPLWDAKRQTFADKIVNTVVIDVVDGQ